MISSILALATIPLAIGAPVDPPHGLVPRDGGFACPNPPFYYNVTNAGFGQNLQSIAGVPKVMSCKLDAKKSGKINYWSHEMAHVWWYGNGSLKAARNDACQWALSNKNITADEAGTCRAGDDDAIKPTAPPIAAKPPQ